MRGRSWRGRGEDGKIRTKRDCGHTQKKRKTIIGADERIEERKGEVAKKKRRVRRSMQMRRRNLPPEHFAEMQLQKRMARPGEEEERGRLTSRNASFQLLLLQSSSSSSSSSSSQGATAISSFIPFFPDFFASGCQCRRRRRSGFKSRAFRKTRIFFPSLAKKLKGGSGRPPDDARLSEPGGHRSVACSPSLPLLRDSPNAENFPIFTSSSPF